MKICHLDKEKIIFREKVLWTPAYNAIYGKLTFTTNKDILFHGIGFFGRTSTDLTMPTTESFKIVMENGDFMQVLENTFNVEQDGSSKMYQVLLNKPFLMKADNAYTVKLIRLENWAEHFVTFGVDSKYNCDGVKFRLMLVGGSFINAFLFDKVGSSCECVLC